MNKIKEQELQDLTLHQLLKRLMVPVFSIVFVSILVFIFATAIAIKKLDQVVVDNSLHLAQTALFSDQRSFGRLVVDYAYWDEAYQKIVISVDEDWLTKSIAKYLSEENDLVLVHIVGGNNQTIFSKSFDVDNDIYEDMIFESHIDKIIESIRSLPEKKSAPLSSIARFNSKLYLMSSTVVINSEQYDEGVVPNDAPVMIFAKVLDQNLLDQWEKDFLLGDLWLEEVSDDEYARGNVGFELKSIFNESVGSLVWKVALPSEQLIYQLSVVAVLLSVFMLLMLWLFSRGSRDAAKLLDRQHRKLIVSEKRFKDVAETAADWIWEMNSDLQFTFFSENAEIVPGESVGGYIGKTPRECVSQQEEDEHGAYWDRHDAVLKEHKDFFDLLYKIPSKDDHVRYISSSAKALFDDDHVFVGYRGTARDITEQRTSAMRLKLFYAIFQNTAEAMMVVDNSNNIVYVNPSFTAVCGFYEKDVVGNHIDCLNASEFKGSNFTIILKSLSDNGIWQGEFRPQHKQGYQLVCAGSISAIKNKQGRVIRYVIMFSDITLRKQDEARIWKQANYDALTNLPNRLLFLDRLEQAWVRVKRDKNLFAALLFVDLDGFKEINDQYGHKSGDIVLQQVAMRLSEFMRVSDTVARYGGDEFTIILRNISHVDDVKSVAQDLVNAIAEPYEIDEQQLTISASIGVSLLNKHRKDIEELIALADRAMYQVKARGKSGYYILETEADDDGT